MKCHHKYILSFSFICNILAILKDEQELLILNPSEVCKYVLYSLYMYINVCMYVCMYVCTHVYMYEHMCI